MTEIDLSDKLNKKWLHPTGKPVEKPVQEMTLRVKSGNPYRDDGGRFGHGSGQLADVLEVKTGTAYYHGTSSDNATSMVKHGFNLDLSTKGDHESPYGLFLSKRKTSDDDHSAGTYGDTIVKVTAKKKLYLLDGLSQTWTDTMGTSRGAKDSAKWAKKLAKAGYDGIDDGNGELVIWNTDKLSFNLIKKKAKK